MRPTVVAFYLLVGITLLVQVTGHGRLMKPPARNAMWRFGYPNPVNFEDNELYCGGFVVHYQKNGGKCGVCGDNFVDKMPRKHEAGGLYGNGIIGKRYVTGQVIDISVELTTNHKGWMELKLCPNNDPKKVVTQECLDQHPLQLVSGPGDGARFIIPMDSKKVETFNWTVKLPDYVTCSQCVMQWTYFAGNTWGVCGPGEEGVGCGPQETFINCADIEIYSNANVPPTNINPWALYHRDGENEHGGNMQLVPYDSTHALRPLVVRSQLCIPKPDYATIRGMDDWCRVNCLKYPPNCPENVCTCVLECDAIGEFAKLPDADVYCHQNCLKYPSHCPPDRCRCF